MRSKGLPAIMTSGFGRRIFGFFMLAGILPVVVTALLAYVEIGRGLEHEVSRQLRDYSKAYGTEVVERLIRASQKADEIARIAEEEGETDFTDYRYLTSDFVSISSSSSAGGTTEHLGQDRFLFTEGIVDRTHLATGNDQLYITDEFGLMSFYLLRGSNIGRSTERIFAFQLDPSVLWALGENSPYQTDFCAYLTSGGALSCSGPSTSSAALDALADNPPGNNFLAEWTGDDGTEFVSADWQLFVEGILAHPAIEIVATQPRDYALRSGADFRRVFPPALALVIMLVGALSLSLIGESLVPLQRLTLVARQIASGHLAARVARH